MKVKNGYFKGYYLKHQKDGKTLAFIPGKSEDNYFVQVITNNFSHCYTLPAVKTQGNIILGDCYFSPQGISVNLPDLKAKIKYFNLTPPKSNVMGPFKFFPMECTHGILSLHHRLEGVAVVNGEEINFSHGTGYIEYDSGNSFPSEYVWLQCNDFQQKCCIMVSVARIPFMGKFFRGCIGIVYYNGIEYRLSTYNGAKIMQADENRIFMRAGNKILDIEIKNGLSHSLYSPINGHMSGIIKESNTVSASFRFFCNNKLVFELKSDNASFEIVKK